jgi:retron-type reverse transcriptase
VHDDRGERSAVVAEPKGSAKNERFLSLAPLIDEDALKRAYDRLRKDAAVGVDGITKEQYGTVLENNIADLHNRMKTMRYRHQPLRRVHIPKGQGKTRPIGISSIEDKIVQGAVREVLEAVYEPTFYDRSYGFRPGRSAQDAMRTLNRVLDAGIEPVAALGQRLPASRARPMVRARRAPANERQGTPHSLLR